MNLAQDYGRMQTMFMASPPRFKEVLRVLGITEGAVNKFKRFIPDNTRQIKFVFLRCDHIFKNRQKPILAFFTLILLHLKKHCELQ
jgi:hypothetical protein